MAITPSHESQFKTLEPRDVHPKTLNLIPMGIFIAKTLFVRNKKAPPTGKVFTEKETLFVTIAK